MTYDYSGEVTVTGKKKVGGDTVSIVSGGFQISGWQSVHITRGIELMPSSFEIGLTEKYPSASQVPLKSGAPCTVMIGDTLVLTGYIDRYGIKIGANSHSVTVTGRGKCEDLVDCSAEWPSSQISNSDLYGIATKLAQPYGIDVAKGPNIGTLPLVQQYNLSLGQSAWEVIELIARFSAVIAYENEYGELVLDTVGSIQAASGFVEGQNIEAGSIEFTMDERFQVYRAYLLSTDVLGDAGNGGNLQATATDMFVPRYRAKDFICEAGAGGLDISTRRVNWELGRRFGRSFQLHLTTDTWRDSATTLWTPNTLAPISSPNMKLSAAMWCLSQVTYRKDETGTHCDLVIMPPAAFQPEPTLIQPNFAPEIPDGLGQPQPGQEQPG